MGPAIDLDGRVCVVAGGGHGIGRVAAESLAENGASVVVNDLGTTLSGEGESPEPAEDVAASIRDDGGEATGHFGDAADLEYAETLIADTLDRYGRLDFVANFANAMRDGYATNLTGEDWDSVIRLNQRPNFALLRAAARHWREVAADESLEPKRGFLAATSESALGNVGQLNYATAKAGVLGFVRTAARELHDTGVRVNAVIPAAFTRATESIPEEYRAYTREEMPPEKTGPTVVYLASQASAHVTGVTVYAGGDRVAIYSDPAPVRQGVCPGGWTAEGLADAFDDLAEGFDLTRTDPLF